MKTKYIAILILFVLLIIIGLGAWFVWHGDIKISLGDLTSSQVATPSQLRSDAPYIGAPLTKSYTNNTFKFSLSMPNDFTAQELPADDTGAHTILLQDSKGNGIQIIVTPNQGNATSLTVADVRASIPDMKTSDDQELEIGNTYKGVAFRSDNDAFGGDSREVWFYFRGNLYQISTYARLDPLLKAMFGTWKFF